jgi:Ras-related GTP-binding protein A/B
MDSYLTTQRSTIFSHVGVLIYVFDVENSDMSKDLEYYRDCVEGLGMFSPEARVYLLVHKMDLVREHRELVFERKRKELRKASGDVPVRVFGTSIYDESLYKVILFFFRSPEMSRMLTASRPGQVSFTRSSPTLPCSQSD